MTESLYALGGRYMTENISLPPGALPTDRAAGSTGVFAHRQDDTGDIVLPPKPFDLTGGPSEETATLNTQATNRVVLFRNEVWRVLGGKVVRWDDGQSAWVTEFDMTGWDGVNIGLYPMSFNPFGRYTVDSEGFPSDFPLDAYNRDYLVTAYKRQNTNGKWTPLRYDSFTQTWESGLQEVDDIAIADGGVHIELNHNNRIIFAGPNSSRVFYEYEPYGETMVKKFLPGDMRWPADMCVYMNRLYCLYKTSDNKIEISELEYSPTNTIVLNDPIYGDAQPFSTSDNYEGRCVLFVDNENINTSLGTSGVPQLYAMYFANHPTNPGYAMWQLQPSGDGGQLQIMGRIDDVLDAGLRYGTAFSTLGNDSVMRFIHDHPSRYRNTDLNTNTDTYILRADGGGDHNGYAGYRWSGPDDHPGGTPASESFTNQWHMSYPQDKMGGGARYFKGVGSAFHDLPIANLLPTMDVVFGLRVFDVFGSKATISYEIIPSSGHDYHAGTPVNVFFMFDENQHMPLKRCTLSNPSGGSIVNNIITGVPANSGVVYSVDWDLTSDLDLSGLGPRQTQFRVNMAGFVAITGG